MLVTLILQLFDNECVANPTQGYCYRSYLLLNLIINVLQIPGDSNSYLLLNLILNIFQIPLMVNTIGHIYSELDNKCVANPTQG